MKKLFASVCFIALATCAFAQQSVTFKWKYLPNLVYSSNMNMNMDMTMDMKGSEAEMAKIKESGQQMPMVMKMDTKLQAEIVTGAKSGTPAKFPLQMNFKAMDMHTSMNGKDMPIPNQFSPSQLNGVCDADGKLTLDAMTGTDAAGQAKAALAKMANAMQDQIKFPEKPMLVGDTFTQEMPMDLPIPGMTSKVNIKSVYKLVSINSGIANFDFDQTIQFNVNMQQAGGASDMTGDGKGNGTFKFDMAKSTISDMTNNMTMNFNLKIQTMTMAIAAKMTNTQHTDISAK